MDILGILEAIRSTVLASIVFVLIPIVWWAFVGRRREGFLAYFGLVKPRINRPSAYIAVVIYSVVWVITHLPVFTQYTQPSASVYTGLGFSAIVPILIISFVQTGTLEEVLFRGFINKRLTKLLGAGKGILVQAVLFGAIHVLIASDLTLTAGSIIFLTTAIGGYMLGYMAEKSFGGSIVPGIFLHGLGNFIINTIQAFS